MILTPETYTAKFKLTDGDGVLHTMHITFYMTMDGIKRFANYVGSINGLDWPTKDTLIAFAVESYQQYQKERELFQGDSLHS